MTEFLCY